MRCRSFFTLSAVTGAAIAAAAALAAGSGAAGVAPAASCRVTLTTANWRAVLGHEPTLARAQAKARQFVTTGYKGTKVENRGCGDFAVVIESPEFSKYTVRNAFAVEVAKAKLVVSFTRPARVTMKPGEVIVVFGHRATLATAVTLLGKVAAKGWRETDIAYGGPRDWKVVWPGVPGTSADRIVLDTLKAGFEVELELAAP